MRNILLPILLILGFTVHAQTWDSIADIPVGKHHPVSFSLDGKGYSVTGTNSFNQNTKDVYRYDPVTNAWTALPDFPGEARSFAIGASYDSMGYMGFGATNNIYLNDLWQYSPKTGQWLQLATCPCTGRRHPAFVIHDSTIFVGLGDGNSGNLNDWWAYDIATNTWTQLADLPGAVRHHPFQFNVNNEVYVGFGHGGPNIFRDWYKFNTNDSTWTKMRTFPGEARVAGTQFANGNFGYVLSGDGDNHSFMNRGEFWRYNPLFDLWDQMPSHPGVSRWAPGSFVIDDIVYFFGGTDRQAGNFPLSAWMFNFNPVNTSLDDERFETKISLHPNPASNQVHWESDAIVSEIHIVNTIGQVVRNVPNPTKAIELGDLNNGIYVLQFFNRGELLNTKKLLIQR